MKRILCILAVISLTGCVSLAFDSLEYDRYVAIKEQSDKMMSVCDNPLINQQVSVLKDMTDHQYLYSINRVARPQVAESATNLKTIVDGLYAKYQSPNKPSLVYCQEKLKNVSIGATTIVRVLGRL